MSTLKTNRIENLTTTDGGISINNNGNVGVGATSPESRLHLRADGDELKSLLNIQNRNTGSNAGSQIAFFNGGVDASDNRLAYIRSYSSGANGNFLTFGTNADGTAPQERMRILASGGITFNGDTAAANALDDFEEGTWTPNLTSSSPGTGSFSAGGNNGGFYTKIGKRVFFQFNLNGTWTAGTASGLIKVSGLPFTNSSSTDRPGNSTYSPVVIPYNDGIDLSSGLILTGGLIVPGATNFSIYAQNNTSSVTVGIANAASSFNIHGSGSYEVP